MDHLNKRKIAALHSLEVSTRHVSEQQERIKQQKLVLQKLEGDNHTGAVVENAKQLLENMELLLRQMLSDRNDAYQRAYPGESLDEASMDAVMRDCPL